jgi:uncharacterized coiled-coil DUF342 family protein
MEDDIRKKLKEMRDEFNEVNRKMNKWSKDIAKNTKKIDDIYDRHIPSNIRSKLCCLCNLNKL